MVRYYLVLFYFAVRLVQKLAQTSQPIRRKMKTLSSASSRVFPRLPALFRSLPGFILNSHLLNESPFSSTGLIILVLVVQDSIGNGFKRTLIVD